MDENKIYHVNNKAGMVILTSEKVNFRVEKITKDKESHYKMLEGSIHKEGITIINL